MVISAVALQTAGAVSATARLTADREHLLRVINAILELSGASAALMVDRLDAMLDDAGSAFTVERTLTPAQLVRRVDPAKRSARQQVIQDAPAEARRHLVEGRVAAFGIEPDPDRAYASAVKAVEDVAIPLMCPAAANPTLGNVLTTPGCAHREHTAVAPRASRPDWIPSPG